MESRAEVVGKDLEEINGQFDRHRGEINCLKIREKDTKEETEQLKGFIVGAGHEAQVFKNRLDRMEENVDLPPFVKTSDPSPAYPASSPPQHSPHLHYQAINAIPDRFPISSLSLPGSLSESPY